MVGGGVGAGKSGIPFCPLMELPVCGSNIQPEKAKELAEGVEDYYDESIRKGERRTDDAVEAAELRFSRMKGPS